jgi:hypothetical protein
MKRLYTTVDKLEAMFESRHFTLDGHIIGSIGECLVADAYGLELKPASNNGFDAVLKAGKKEIKQVEIKATQSDRVAFRSCPKHTIIIKILPTGDFKEYYNGPGEIIWKKIKSKKEQKNGQRSITLNQAKSLMNEVAESEKITRIPLEH